jgi:predicted patatin/cPLA2 family phospholipase
MEHKLYYKHYCKILSKVIKEVKKLYYKEIITKSKKIKTAWNTILKEISNPTNENNIKSVKTNNHIVHNEISIADEFNNYFLNIAGSTSTKGIN